MKSWVLLILFLTQVHASVELLFSCHPANDWVEFVENEAVHCVADVIGLTNFTVEVDFGDGTAKYIVSNQDRLVFDHTFLEDGVFTVVASIPGVVSESLSLHVKPMRSSCLEFYPLSSTILKPNQTLELSFGLHFIRSDGLTADAHENRNENELIREFINFGERPRVSILGDTELSAVNIMDGQVFAQVGVNGTSWTVHLHGNEWQGTAWLTIASMTKATLNGDCGIRDTTIPIVVSSRPQINTRGSSEAQGIIIATTSDFIDVQRVSYAVCMPSSGAVTVNVSGSKWPAIALSDDGFDTYTIFARDQMYWANETATNVCGSGFCERDDLVIWELKMVSPELLVLITSLASFTVRVSDEYLLLSEIDTGDSNVKWRSASSSSCYGELGREAALVIPGDGFTEGVFLVDDAGQRVIHIRHGNRENQEVLVRNLDHFIEFFDAPHRRLDAILSTAEIDRALLMFSSPNRADEPFFIGSLCTSREKTDPTCWEHKHGQWRLVPKLTYVFPKGENFHGLCAHGTGLAKFAYGDGLWISYDIGQTFEKILQLPSDEEIVGCPISGPVLSEFFVFTTKSRLFFGKIHVKGVIPIVNKLPTNSLISISSSNRPYWIRWNSDDDKLEKMFIPSQHATQTHHEYTESRLVASSLYGERIALMSVDNTKTSGFGPQHRGLIVEPLNALIYDVDVSTGVAYARSRDIFTAGKIQRQRSEIYGDCSIRVSRDGVENGVVQQCREDENGFRLSVNLTMKCEGVVVDPPQDMLITLSIIHGGGVFLTDLDSNSSTCFFGSFKNNETYDPSEWQGTTTGPADWCLTVPSCPIVDFRAKVPLQSPVIRILDRYDMYLWQGILGSPRSDENKLNEREDHLVWSRLDSSDRPLQVIRNNRALTHIHENVYEGTNTIGLMWSYNRQVTDFPAYQSVFPAHLENDTTFSGLMDPVTNLVLKIEPNGVRDGRMTTVLVTPRDTCLSCGPTDEALTRILVDCPRYKELKWVQQESDSFSFMELPVNYRPPSYRGKGIPLTSNVYNADPSTTLYMDWYAVSRDSARFKQCHGKANREACGCDHAVNSTNVAESDCIRYTQTTLFNNYFVPKFAIRTTRDGSNVSLSSTFRIRDVNGRIDYCTNASSFDSSNCGELPNIHEFAFDPVANDAILFVGEGMYHFEVTIKDPVSFCELKTYILIFVLEPPISTRIESITISITAISFLLFGLIAYLAYFYWNRLHAEDQYHHVPG